MPPFKRFKKNFRVQAVGMFLSSFIKFYEKNRGAQIEEGYETNYEFSVTLKMLSSLAFEKEEK